MESTVEKQFIQAYDTYADAIYRYCYYRVFDKDKAQDYMQEAYCRTWKYISEGHHIENLKAFIYRTAGNIIIDEARKKHSFSLNALMEKGFSPSTDPREATQNHFMAEEVIDVIKSLDKKYQDVIVLKYIEDLSTKEIASILNETENNIYVRINRGFEKVKLILA